MKRKRISWFLAAVFALALLAPFHAQAMNKAELVDAIASKSGLSKADAKRALDGFVNTTAGALKKGDRVSLVGFGSFSISRGLAPDRCEPENRVEFEHDLDTAVCPECERCTVDDDELILGMMAEAQIELASAIAAFDAIVPFIHKNLREGWIVDIEGFGEFYMVRETPLSRRGWPSEWTLPAADHTGDLNGDGLEDVVLTGRRTGDLDGDGRPDILIVGASVGDLDRDGQADVGVASRSSDRDPRGRRVEVVVRGHRVGDLNGDGRPDIVVVGERVGDLNHDGQAEIVIPGALDDDSDGDSVPTLIVSPLRGSGGSWVFDVLVTGRNPQTGKEIKIAAKNVVKFKAGADLSKKVN